MFGGRNLMSSFNSNSCGGILSTIKSKISMNAISIIIFVVIIIALSIYYYYQYVAPKVRGGYVANKQPNIHGSGDKQSEFMFFYADWCPHCKTAKPEWEKVKEEYQGKTINGYIVVFKDINCSTETPETRELMTQYKVQGYPTLKLIKDGQVIDFDSKPTESSIVQFLNSVL